MQHVHNIAKLLSLQDWELRVYIVLPASIANDIHSNGALKRALLIEALHSMVP